MDTISWRTPTQPLPMELNPRVVFERMFGGDGTSAAARRARLEQSTSILDAVAADVQGLGRSLASHDKARLEEYLANVREVERRIVQAEAQRSQNSLEAPPTPAGVPQSFEEHVNLMFELQALAFQGDLTRVTTMMVGREGSTRTYREIGVSDAHHPLTHHRNNPEWIEKVTKINCFHLEQFAYFVNKLKSTPDGDGTLLDRVMVVYGSGLADGNQHTHADLPVLLAGAGNGAIRPGRHVRYPKETPMNNLYVAMLDHMGIPPEHIGDSTGELQHLTDLS